MLGINLNFIPLKQVLFYHVIDLTKHLVSDFESIHDLMVEGSNVRQV